MLTRLIAFFKRLFCARQLSVSKKWLADHESDKEVEFHGVSISWPIDKLNDARGWRNRVTLRAGGEKRKSA